VRGSNVLQLTDDHTLINSKVKHGMMTKAEAEKAAGKNVITRAVGHKDYVQVDTADLDARVGDRFFLCTDGMHGYLDDHPLGYRKGTAVRDYLLDRVESLCRLVPGAVEVYLRLEFIEQAMNDGVNPVEVVRRTLGDILIDGWTLNADNPQAETMLRLLLESGVGQVTTDTPVQLAALLGQGQVAR
jgi:hypothetical protein